MRLWGRICGDGDMVLVMVMLELAVVGQMVSVCSGCG